MNPMMPQPRRPGPDTPALMEARLRRQLAVIGRHAHVPIPDTVLQAWTGDLIVEVPTPYDVEKIADYLQVAAVDMDAYLACVTHIDSRVIQFRSQERWWDDA